VTPTGKLRESRPKSKEKKKKKKNLERNPKRAPPREVEAKGNQMKLRVLWVRSPLGVGQEKTGGNGTVEGGEGPRPKTDARSN